MEEEYLLDTNAYFTLLREIDKGAASEYPDSVATLKAAALYISAVTKVEIISVIGKYARGQSGGWQTCDRRLDDKDPNKRCSSRWYAPPSKRWRKKRVERFVTLVKETIDGSSPLFSLTVLPFDNTTIQRAEIIIRDALIHSFASMDAMIAATAKAYPALTVVTADKALTACLNAERIPVWNAFP